MTNSPAENSQIVANKLAQHVGGGDDAHLWVDFDHAGFMEPNQLMALFHANGREKQLPATPTDVFSLTAGHFYSSNLTNAPSANGQGAWIIDVSKPEWNGQMYLLRNIANGEIWYQVKHIDKNGNSDSLGSAGWTKIETAFPLWSGDLSALSTPVTLADDRSKFRLIRVGITTDGGFNDIQTFVNGPEFTLSASQVTSNSYGAYIYQANLRLAGKSASLVVNRSTQILATSVAPYTGLIHVTSIEGII
ncbi:hypothetical protein [Lacticaseibacillus paracasei]|uniref:hypothetical protein n=1 Tax=Lacticaseibacillus paracasei TaxID=1597 RepID=UPI003BA1D854